MAYVSAPLPPAPHRPHTWAEYRVIPPGSLGIEATVRAMRRLARSEAPAPLVRETAAAVVAGARDDATAAAQIRTFLERHTRFEWDPDGVELVRSPLYMLREIDADGVSLGDCDDVATLAAALALAAGLRSRFVLYGFTPTGPYEHVFTEILTPAGPIELDTTRPAQMPAGLEILQVGHRRV